MMTHKYIPIYIYKIKTYSITLKYYFSFLFYIYKRLMQRKIHVYVKTNS